MKKTRVFTCLFLVLFLGGLAFSALSADTFPPSSYPLYHGIDVSAWQDTITWSSVPSSGVQIAYIRATEGDSYIDPKLTENYAGAKSAGLKIGFYHFLTAQTVEQAQAQAVFFASTLYDKHLTADCRLVMDFGGGGSLSLEQFNAVASAFLKHLEALTGGVPMIYTDASRARDRYSSALTVYPIWVADYGVTLPEANGKWASWAGFQYTDRGRVDGISGNVDLDSFTKEIFIGETPVTPTPTLTPKPATSVSQFYQVQTGDTLLNIAARYHVTPQAIVTINDTIPDSGPVAGQILKIQTFETPKTGAFASLYLPVSNTTFAFTARHFSVSESDLLAANQQPFGSAVKAGQAVKIPSVTDRAVISAPDTLLENTYMAKSGDTYASIAEAFSISEAELLSYNTLSSSDTLWPGQLLHLRPFGVSGTKESFYGAYSVRRGDSLSRIARQFSVTVDALFNANNMINKSDLSIGQVLIIP